jgi:membrane-bound lytic murein transglycosylase B
MTSRPALTTPPTGSTSARLGGATRHARLPLLLAALLLPATGAASFLERDGVRAFIDEVSDREGFNAAELRGLFEDIERQEAVLEAIARPAEALPWKKYRPIFVTDERVAAGVTFAERHRETLERAERTYGVPPAIVTAIIGVETYYGRHEGRHPVLDTLATLAFEYTPRAAFFRSELEQFLLLARNEGLDPRAVDGSYAGAMGMPQFISSSYRAYAVDFDGDGRRDLWDSTEDVVGSVAAYLGEHGWRRGAPVTERVRPGAADYGEFLRAGLRPSVPGERLAAAGIELEQPVAPDARLTVIELAGEEGPEVWVGWRNFYVITRYNHSPLYAMAVHQLAEGIRAAQRRERRP